MLLRRIWILCAAASICAFYYYPDRVYLSYTGPYYEVNEDIEEDGYFAGPQDCSFQGRKISEFPQIFRVEKTRR